MATDWTLGGLWPYEPRWFETPGGRLHYIDEGPRDGCPVVLVHGNPTWGFLYRNFVGPLVDAGYRVIVPDHLGFGRSDKPSRPDLYRLAAHIDRLDTLLESLDLTGATVVPHDWGGPIGLAWAVAHPERVASLFILNTTAHRPQDKLPVPARLFRLPGVGELLVHGLGPCMQRLVLFRVGVVHRERLTPLIKQGYLAPHRRLSRTGVLMFPREIPDGPDAQGAETLAQLELGLERHFRDKPVQIVWGMKDLALRPRLLQQWLDTFPDATVMRLPDAGHYLQEDAHERIVPALLEFLATNASR